MHLKSQLFGRLPQETLGVDLHELQSKTLDSVSSYSRMSTCWTLGDI